jgi:hypothetical protein
MKKILLIAFALVLVAVALVSATAFEAHMVDVRAHVENAVWVDPYEIDYGITFPEVSYDEPVCIGLSESFEHGNQTRFCDVYYVMFWEEKPIEGHEPTWGGAICDPDGDGNFSPIWPYIYINPSPGDGLFDPLNPYPLGDWRYVPQKMGAFAWGTLNKLNGHDPSDHWMLKFQAPVFEGYWNPTTDPKPGYKVIPKDQYCLAEERVGCDIGGLRDVLVPHADLGGILKFQVWDYSLCP